MVYIAIEKLLHLNIVFIGQDFQDPTKNRLKNPAPYHSRRNETLNFCINDSLIFTS